MDVLPRLAALGAVLLLVGCSSSSGASGAAGPTAHPSASASPSPVPSPSPTPTPTPTPLADPTYVALGDSVAAGVGADDPARQGYVPVLADVLSQRRGCDAGPAEGCPVRLRSLAVPGATTETLLRDQLPTALELLGAGGVRLVTVTVGGNDVFVPVLQACARAPQAPSCAAAVRAALGAVDTRRRPCCSPTCPAPPGRGRRWR